MTAAAVVLFAVSSPVVVDVEESARRAGVAVAAAVRNVADPAWLLDPTREIEPASLTPALCAIGFLVPLFTPGNRQRAAREAFSVGFRAPATLVDPTAIVPASLELGAGVYVNAGCTVGAAARLDEFVFVNRGACLGHHVVLDRFVSIGPGVVLGGQVAIGRGTLVGAGAVVLPGVRVGENSVIGAGSVVTRDVPDRTLVLGSPARVAKTGIAGYKDLEVE